MYMYITAARLSKTIPVVSFDLYNFFFYKQGIIQLKFFSEKKLRIPTALPLRWLNKAICHNLPFFSSRLLFFQWVFRKSSYFCFIVHFVFSCCDLACDIIIFIFFSSLRIPLAQQSSCDKPVLTLIWEWIDMCLLNF